MGTVRPAGLVCALIALLAGAPETFGHGPCGCTGPAFEGERALEVEATPGDRLVVMQPAIEIVWNPAAKDLRIDPPPELADDHVADAPTVTLVRSEKRRRHVVGVPDVPDGRYLMAVYDGSEGGDHYTWDHVRVSASRASPSGAAPNDGTNWLWVVLAAGGGLAVGWLAGRWRKRPSQTRGGASESDPR